MLDLPPSVHCHTFMDIKPAIPLLIGFEFSQKSTSTIVFEWNLLSEMKAVGQWDFDLQPALNYLKGNKSAVIITNPSQKITWVSQGFRGMTGYAQEEAYGRHPSFLQGEETSSQTRQEIRQHLADGQAFSGTVINYRKSGKAYLCAIQLLPVFNKSRDLVNFIALEKEEPMNSQFF